MWHISLIYLERPRKCYFAVHWYCDASGGYELLHYHITLLPSSCDMCYTVLSLCISNDKNGNSNGTESQRTISSRIHIYICMAHFYFLMQKLQNHLFVYGYKKINTSTDETSPHSLTLFPLREEKKRVRNRKANWCSR